MLASKPDQPPRGYKVGDRILVNLRGRIEEATITEIIERTSGKKLQVDFGKKMAALIDTWQVVDEN
jgi:hypothetical protein